MKSVRAAEETPRFFLTSTGNVVAPVEAADRRGQFFPVLRGGHRNLFPPGPEEGRHIRHLL